LDSLLKSLLISIKKAASWASEYMERSITSSNISYLIQYAKIKKYQDDDGINKIKVDELKAYYDKFILPRETKWVEKLGDNLDWELSFDQYPERETTKHVHRLHPYKGKFIPQLVEYFLDGHTDKLKTEPLFKSGDVIIDPFMGSGTSLVQSTELGINSIGIDISEFNCMIAQTKIEKYNLPNVLDKLSKAVNTVKSFSIGNFNDDFNLELKNRISSFNSEYFPNPEVKLKFREGKLNENDYSFKCEEQFLTENQDFLWSNGLRKDAQIMVNGEMPTFLNQWYSKRIRGELYHFYKIIQKLDDEKLKNIFMLVLSRTARSCRATTHSDLATLKKPQILPYYCRKHKKICTPINSITKHLNRYMLDTMRRLSKFSDLRNESYSCIIHGDSRNINILESIKKRNKKFYELVRLKGIKGVFTSPPYVGQIDYHEQHAYAYELFDIQRRDSEEIGSKSKGKGKQAQIDYTSHISEVLTNISQFLLEDANLLIVANDKFSLYREIAKKSDLQIIKEYRRPVLNRTERDRQPYSESIFHMKKIL